MKDPFSSSHKVSAWYLRYRLFLIFLVLAVSVGLISWVRLTSSASDEPTSLVKQNSLPRTTLVPANPETSAEKPGSISSDSSSSTPIPLAGTRANLKSKRQTISLTGDDGIFDRVMIDESQPVQIGITLNQLRPGEKVFITAPNGGTLSREGGPLEFSALSDKQSINLAFEPTIGRGAYTVRIQHAGESQIIDLWAGAPNPLGQPGPAYIPSQFSAEVP